VLLPRLTGAFWWVMVETRILLAPVLASLDRSEEAAAALNEAEQLLAAHPDAGELPGWHHEAAQDIRRVKTGRQPSQSLSDAELRIVRLLGSDLTLAEIGRELCLSHNTVKTHAHWIYRKLGVSSRSDAVKVAREQASARSPGR